MNLKIRISRRACGLQPRGGSHALQYIAQTPDTPAVVTTTVTVVTVAGCSPVAPPTPHNTLRRGSPWTLVIFITLSDFITPSDDVSGTFSVCCGSRLIPVVHGRRSRCIPVLPHATHRAVLAFAVLQRAAYVGGKGWTTKSISNPPVTTLCPPVRSNSPSRSPSPTHLPSSPASACMCASVLVPRSCGSRARERRGGGDEKERGRRRGEMGRGRCTKHAATVATVVAVAKQGDACGPVFVHKRLLV